MSTIEFLNKLPAALNADTTDGVDCTIQLNGSSPAVIKIANGACSVSEGSSDAADVSLTMTDEDMMALLTGQLDGMTAFMTGRLQIDGDLMLAKEITGYFNSAQLA